MTILCKDRNITERVFLQEKIDGSFTKSSINLANFNYPDGIYKVSILDKDGDVISKNNKIIKNGRDVELHRRFEGCKNMIMAQSYRIPMNNLNQKVLQFIMDNCKDINKIFIDVMPSLNNRLIDTKHMVYVDENNNKERCRGGWIPVEDINNGYDSIDIDGRVVKFEDIMEFSEKYMIVKGFMQVGKSKFIISSSVWFMLNGMSSIIVLRNYNGDKNQFIRRISEYNDMLQEFLGHKLKDKFKVETITDKTIQIEHFTDNNNPKIIVCIAHPTPLKKLNNIVENPKVTKKYALFLDEVDFIDSEGTCVQKELDKLRQHCFCSYGVSATILDSTFKRDVEKGNVIILSTPENYKSIINFKYVHLPYESTLVATATGDVLQSDFNIMTYLDEFSEKKPYYVELYDDEKYGDKDDIRSKCHHPVISLLRVSITNNPNLQLLSFISTGYNFPVMYFQGGKGAGHITLSLPSETNSIMLINGCKSIIQNSIELIDSDKNITITIKGDYHIFDNASPAIILEWFKNTGGGVKRFPRIMIIAGCLASRCQSFGASDFNVCLSDKKLAWHLTEMYLIASTGMDQPELIQTAGRLCVVARDNIQPIMYSTKQTCVDLINAYQTQEELIERARKDENKKYIGKIIEKLPIYNKKIVIGRSLTKKAYYELNLVTEEIDKSSGGWDKDNTYCSKDKSGKNIINGELYINADVAKLIEEERRKNVNIIDDESAIYISNEDGSPVMSDIVQYGLDNYKDIISKFKKWSTATSNIGKFCRSIQLTKVYTDKEFKKLCSETGTDSTHLQSRTYGSSSGYGRIIEKLDGNRYRLYPVLVYSLRNELENI